MRVIGTAGHIDHGKSTLVQALTGIDPDRLREEKAREMTIDLGFAWMELPNGENFGFVDVPGHIDFIKNMLAGVGGIDAALLVIAADEGVMPQTREHLAILDLLEVPAGVVALTKADIIESEPGWLDLVTEEVHEVLQDTRLADAPIVPISARRGQGLERLLQELQQVLAEAPERSDKGRPRLPIDRAFSIAGFGTVVTGTLSDGRLRVGDEVEIAPSGPRARIRGLQTHQHTIQEAVPGSRVAINLSGVHHEEIERGWVVTLPGVVPATQLVDVRLRLLPDATQNLGHNLPVDFFTGAASSPARTRLLDAQALKPGEEGWVQLRLERPIALLAGDHFIIRQPSPSHTLGGGVVVDATPRRRWRRFRPEVIQRLETLVHGTPAQQVEEALAQQEPATWSEVLERLPLSAEVVRPALDELLQTEQVLNLTTGAEITAEAPLVSRAGWRTLTTRLEQLLREHHARYPLRAGMPRGELRNRLERGRLKLAARIFNQILVRAAQEGLLLENEAIVRIPDHQVRFTPEQQAKVDQLLQRLRESPLNPPAVSEMEKSVGGEVLNALIEQGQLIRLRDDVVFASDAYREIVERIIEFMQDRGQVTVAEARDFLGTSRKHALALMEYLDNQRITRRVGDERVLRGNITRVNQQASSQQESK